MGGPTASIAFVRAGAGYASDMSTSSTNEGDIKPGPANPAAEGVDAPTPPGGPQRQDHAETGTPGEHDQPDGNPPAGDTIPIEDEQPDADASDQATAVQQENAATSLDQPSDGLT